MKLKRNKENKGITLMALIITIIILLILSGISISMITGNNGIINKAVEAKEKTAHQNVYETLNMKIMEETINNITDNSTIMSNFLTKGYIYKKEGIEGYIVDVEKLMGGKQEYGNGTDGKTDVYKIEEESTTASNTKIATTNMENIKIADNNSNDKKYQLIYYGKDEKDISKIGEITINGSEDIAKKPLPSNSGTKPYYPSAKFSQVTGTSLESGLIIQDDNENEYVWIAVPNDGTGPDYSGFDVTNSYDYDNIERALHNYAKEYWNFREDMIYKNDYDGMWYNSAWISDDWSDSQGKGYGDILLDAIPSESESSSSSGSESPSSSGSESPSSSESARLSSSRSNIEIKNGSNVRQTSTELYDTSRYGLTYYQYETLKNKMLTSIYEHGGFWIGRYHAGMSSPRTEYTPLNTNSDGTIETDITVLSKESQYPINYVYCKEAQGLASKVALDVELEEYSSSLLFAIQWALTYKYVDETRDSSVRNLPRDMRKHYFLELGKVL